MEVTHDWGIMQFAQLRTNQLINASTEKELEDFLVGTKRGRSARNARTQVRSALKAKILVKVTIDETGAVAYRYRPTAEPKIRARRPGDRERNRRWCNSAALAAA